MSLKLTHQYVVSYYAESVDHCTSVVWRDILTDKIERHDGLAPYAFTYTEGLTKQSKLITDYLPFWIKEPNKPQPICEHQYVVSYYEDERVEQRIVWRDILTDKVHKHDGPAVIHKYLIINTIMRDYYVQDELLYYEIIEPNGFVSLYDACDQKM